METESFLTIDNQPISLSQALSYLRATGDLQTFLLKIIRQHILEIELKTRHDLEIDLSLIEQAVLDFRLVNQLADPDQFQSWLQSQSLSYDDFRHQIAAGLRIEKLKSVVTTPALEQYFIQEKPLLDQVVISRIVVDNLDLAVELQHQILDDGKLFEHIAKEHSITSDSLTNGMIGAISLGQLPESVRNIVMDAPPSVLLGPVEHEGNYILLRVERWLPANLEGQLKQQLQEKLFDQWLQEKAAKLAIKMHVD